MKKASIALFAITAAAISHAVTVEWTSGDLSAAKAAQADIQGITAYYYVIDGNTALENAYAAGDWTSESLKAFYNDDGTLNGITATASSGAINAAASADGLTANWTQTLDPDAEEYVLAVYVAKSAFGGSYAMATIGHHVVDDSVLGGGSTEDYTKGLGQDAYDYAVDNTLSAWTPVPEPTTVALLALGLAAVGLKRKVA